MRLKMHDWQFVAFVHTARLQFTALQDQLGTSIFMLLHHKPSKAIKLVCVNHSPYQSDSTEETMPSLHVFSGKVELPGEKSIDKLMKVDLLTDKPFDATVYVLVL
jgi:hypothetical protein